MKFQRNLQLKTPTRAVLSVIISAWERVIANKEAEDGEEAGCPSEKKTRISHRNQQEN